MSETNVLVIGGGPAGYVAALRAAQLGGRVTLVEESKLGGVCLNCGCIPTKFLLHGADLYHSIDSAKTYGIDAENVSINISRLQAAKSKVTQRLVGGVDGLLGAAKVRIIKGKASFNASNSVVITDSSGSTQTLTPEKIIISTGASPAPLPIPGTDASDILNYRGLLDLEKIPESMVLIGGGVIGVEMATFINRIGCSVSVIEMMPRILPTNDAECVAVVSAALKKDGINIYCGSTVEKIESIGDHKKVAFFNNKERLTLEVEKVAITAGMRPNTGELGLDRCEVAFDKQGIKVNDRMETSVPGVYAAGDVTGGVMLAHVAYAEGKVAAENAMGGQARMNYQAIPQCIFTSPELSAVGLTEEEAEKDYSVQVGRFPFEASGMAAILGETRGFVKIISEKRYGRILGIHIVGPSASTLIAEATLAMNMECTPQEIIETIHSHPSLSEAFWESALAVNGETLHFPV